jgi:ribosome-binding factor A
LYIIVYTLACGWKNKETNIDERRRKKLESLIARDVEDIIRREVSDPRITFCTITAVKVTPDAKNAKITVSFLGSEGKKKCALAGIKSACPFIQHKLAQRLPLRFTPVLEFVLDEHAEYRIEELLSEIHKEQEANKPNDSE